MSTPTATPSKPLAQLVREALHPTNPYEGFDPQGRRPSALSTTRDPFMKVFERLRPSLVVEVGAWKGSTSAVFAHAMRRWCENPCLVCVDTWLGSIEHFTVPPSPEWDLRPMMEHGFPRLYEHWMTTIVHEGVEDIVVPLANTSVVASRWFTGAHLRPGFVFVDAGHEEEDVREDLRVWYPLLAPGGIIAGDDWSSMWPGVERAVNAFSIEHGLTPQIVGPNWMLQKPGG